MISTALLIFFARIVDVSLGTMRMVSVINGRRRMALCIGFFEVLIWILVVAKVVDAAPDHPLLAVAYAAGFAAGNFIGITIEGKIAFGGEVIRVFTRKGDDMAQDLRNAGFRVTRFEGAGRDGPISLLFIKIERRKHKALTTLVRDIDPDCFYTVEPLRQASLPAAAAAPIGGWRAVFVRK